MFKYVASLDLLLRLREFRIAVESMGLRVIIVLPHFVAYGMQHVFCATAIQLGNLPATRGRGKAC
jgi:hypothetical protein